MIYSDLKYDHQSVINFDDLHTETKTVLNFIGKKKTVLEVGCHSGLLSEWLQKQSCIVTGIDINEFALDKARLYQKETILGNIEKEEIWELLSTQKFDTITFVHVLEHLVDPWSVVKNAIKLLNENGAIIIGLPNFSNAKDRFNIFFGNFEYTEIGVLDITHLRFFNYKTALELIDKSGLIVDEYYSSTKVNPVREFIDHLPFFCHFRFFLKKKNPFILPFSKNITDVVMLFKCKKK